MRVSFFWDLEPTGRRRQSEHRDVLVARPRKKIPVARRPVGTNPQEFKKWTPGQARGDSTMGVGGNAERGLTGWDDKFTTYVKHIALDFISTS